ncbi:MAG: phosphodiesterase [Cellulosilyticaceae bacterium]
MKYMILSDIHGSKTYLLTALDAFSKHHCDTLILLGDILYHGPRNQLPNGHDPQGVVALLNPYASKIIACRGNCDAEVDQMLLAFPCLSDYALILDEGIRIFATHGHIYNPNQLPPLCNGDIFLYGHTHLWELANKDGIIICNPGSVSLPKENRPPTYVIYENKKITIYTLDGQVLSELTF